MAKCKECGKEFSVSSWKLTPELCSECGQEMTAEEAAFQELLAQSTPRLFVTPIVLVLNILIFAVMVISGVSFLSPTIEQLLAW